MSASAQINCAHAYMRTCARLMLKNAIWLFTFALLTLIFFLPSYTQMQDLKHKNAEYEHQIQDLARKNIKLKEEKRLLTDDPEYFEKVARERMGLVKENEVIYKFVPANEAKEVKSVKEEKKN